jgi:hypothetical protein
MRLVLTLGIVMLAALGCGRESTVPVAGTVLLDGRPLARALVEFQPMAQAGDAAPGPSSRGQTDAQGRFTLHVVGGPGAGAVPGKHRVRITAYEGDIPSVTGEANPSPVPQTLPEWYNTETELTCEVSPKGTKSADFRLSSDHRFAPVSGRVTLDGAPLSNALVVFVPQPRARLGDPGPQSSAKTDERGQFTLRVDGRREAGAVIGLHQVRILRLADGQAPPAEAPAVRTFKVPVKGTEAADFALTAAPGGGDKPAP